MKAWKGYFLNQKLAKKMLVIVVILVAAISFSFFTSLHYLIRSYDDNMYRLAETGLKQTIGDLNRRLNDISRLAGDIAADMDVQENMIVLGAPDMEHMDSRARLMMRSIHTMITMNIFCPFLCSLTAVWSTWDTEPTWILKSDCVL